MGAKLSDKSVKAMQPPSKGNRIAYDSDVAGFGSRVTAAGARGFILNYRRKADGLERRWTIGSFPDWTVGAARDEAKRLKRLIDGGADPVGENRADRAAPTVADLCDRFVEEVAPRLRAATSRDYSIGIRKYIKPALGRHKVASVTHSDVAALHRRITASAPYQANRAIALRSRLVNLSIRWGWRTDNPAKGIERNQETKRHRYLSPDELLRLTAALAEHSDQQAANIFRLLLLTGARRGEVLAAKWADHYCRRMDETGCDDEAKDSSSRPAFGTGAAAPRRRSSRSRRRIRLSRPSWRAPHRIKGELGGYLQGGEPREFAHSRLATLLRLPARLRRLLSARDWRPTRAHSAEHYAPLRALGRRSAPRCDRTCWSNDFRRARRRGVSAEDDALKMRSGFIPCERPSGSVDIEELAQADYALERAREYDFEPLVKRLRSATAFLFPEELELAAKILEGNPQVKRPEHRPANPEVLRTYAYYRALCVWTYLCHGLLLKQAVHQVANDEKTAGRKISESTVSKAWQANRSLFENLPRRPSGK
jgi:integrase